MQTFGVGDGAIADGGNGFKFRTLRRGYATLLLNEPRLRTFGVAGVGDGVIAGGGDGFNFRTLRRGFATSLLNEPRLRTFGVAGVGDGVIASGGFNFRSSSPRLLDVAEATAFPERTT